MDRDLARSLRRWSVRVVLVGAACTLVAWVILRQSREDPYSAARMGEVVRMRCTETGREWDAVRGRIESELMARPGVIAPDQGVGSPFADGRPTGIMVDAAQWRETLDRINAEKRSRRSMPHDSVRSAG
ncbi:MAG: hypothetical protein H6811_10765 [Phycisphaeraceae bacterium]|nr:hypothetical protein [Phycisphaeraceae bacterium]